MIGCFYSLPDEDLEVLVKEPKLMSRLDNFKELKKFMEVAAEKNRAVVAYIG